MLRPRVAAIAGLVLAVGLLGSACGGGTTGTEATPGTTAGSLTSTTVGTDLPGSTAPATSEPTTTSPTEPPSPPPPTTAQPAGAAPCTAPAQDGYTTIGDGRRALVHAGPATARRPAVVVLHGYTGTPERIEETSGWTRTARDVGAVVAYPEGTPVSQGGFGWNTGSARFSTSGSDDISYLASVVDHLVNDSCVDPNRILLAGESNGGAMTLLAACDPATSDRFGFFAPVIPAIDEAVVARCGSGPPVSFVALAGRLDRTIPYGGGSTSGEAPMLAQEEWFQQVATTRNGCGTGEPTRVPIEGGQAIRAPGCENPLLVAIDDAPHTWPGGPVGTGGMAPGRFPTNRYLWAVFQQSWL